jgi:hypothetical protein
MLDGEKHEILGKDLKEGMCFILNGDLFPIINLEDIRYVGTQDQKLPIGHKPKPDFIRKKFIRISDNEGNNKWVSDDKKSVSDNIYIITESEKIADEARSLGVLSSNIFITGITDRSYTVQDCIETISAIIEKSV